MPTLIAPSGHALALPRLPCRIGTATTNDVPIQGGLGVAGHHVTFTQENGAVVIEDSGSGLGTFINGAPVHRQALRGGESVRIGSLELKFEHDGPQASPPWRRTSSGQCCRASDATRGTDDATRGTGNGNSSSGGGRI